MFNKENLNVKQFRGQGFMTIAKFDSSGELLFIADKDSKYISQISTTNNELVGTYNGHNGVVWYLDISPDSKYMISCSGDMTCIVWDVESGEILNRISETGIPKYVSINNDLVAVVCDPISKRSKSYISIYSLGDLINGEINQIAKLDEEKSTRATTVNWLTDEIIIVTYDDGTIKKINYKLRETIQESKIHDESIKSVFFSNTRAEILTSGLDKCAKIIDVESLKIQKTFKSTVPVNYAIFTPDQNYVMLGGGIDAMQVSMINNNDFTTKIYQVSNEKLLKQVTNHFGPLRYLDFNPNKSSFVTASQDGSAKIHYLVPATNIKSNRELFGLALSKEPGELCLKTDNIKIEEVNGTIINNRANTPDANNTSNTSNTSNTFNTNNKLHTHDNKSQSLEQAYPIGHSLYKKEEKISEYKINSRLEIESRAKSSIKVSNLPVDIDVRDLWEMFEFYGRIEENGIRVKKSYNDTFAFVNYLNIESAQKAIEKCDKIRMGFCIIGVEMSRGK
jgi:translation initiation factor 3 subunit I